MRSYKLERKTKETDICCEINVDGCGLANVDTGIGFFDHMLNTLSRHSSIDLFIKCNGDLNVDSHHSVEDCGIVLGEALNKAVGDKSTICRYQSFVMPMDDALVLCAIDVSNRSYYESNFKPNISIIGNFETECVDEFFRSLAFNFKINLHFYVIRGNNTHHIIEAMFKSFAKCLHDAIRINDNRVLSTKGVL